MPTVMIMGASRGIGLELAHQYAADGWCVHATTRTPAWPGPLGALVGDVVLHALDVREAAQIAGLAAAVAQEGIDVLIHNAGVSGQGMRRDEVMTINAENDAIGVSGVAPDAGNTRDTQMARPSGRTRCVRWARAAASDWARIMRCRPF